MVNNIRLSDKFDSFNRFESGIVIIQKHLSRSMRRYSYLPNIKKVEKILENVLVSSLLTQDSVEFLKTFFNFHPQIEISMTDDLLKIQVKDEEIISEK